MTCPACGIENLPSAPYCDCGHEFVPGSRPKETALDQPRQRQCPKCNAFNPATYEHCTKCGEVMRKKTSPFLIGCLGLFAIIVLIGLFNADRSDTSTSPPPSAGTPSSSSPTPSSRPVNPIQETKPKPGSQWSYSTDEDTMGRKQSIAIVRSTNTLSFDFPYQGVQHGTLVIRRSAQQGTNVLLRIEKGQFLCGIDECTVAVRFDTGPIQRFSATGPADHSTTTLFLNSEARFIAQMRQAKVVKIEATFYQAGSQALEFNVEGFKWP